MVRPVHVKEIIFKEAHTLRLPFKTAPLVSLSQREEKLSKGLMEEHTVHAKTSSIYI
jgi:hypothetical protein